MVLVLAGVLAIVTYACLPTSPAQAASRQSKEDDWKQAVERVVATQRRADVAATAPRRIAVADHPAVGSGSEARGNANAIRIEVTDRHGRAVQGASIARSPGLPRFVRPGAEEPVGVTDGSGHLVLDRSPADAPNPQDLVVRATGFLPAAVTEVEWGSVARLALQEGIEWRARALDTAGAPLPDVDVFLSLSVLPVGLAACLGAGPGPVPRESVHHGRSDASGNILVCGLMPGAYHLRVSHPTHTWVAPDDESGQPTLVMPCPETVFVMEQALGCLVKIEGVTVLAKGYTYNSTARRHWHWAYVVREFMDRWKDDPTVLCAVRDSSSSDELLRARVFVLGEGWREVTVPMGPLALQSEPTPLRLEMDPNRHVGGEESWGTCTIDLSDRSGNRISAPLVLATGRHGWTVPVQSGVARQVPVGAYRINAYDPFLDEAVGQTVVRVMPGSTIVVPIAADVVRCKWNLRVEGRPLPGFASCQILEGDGSFGPRMIVESGSTMWCRRGRLRFHLLTPFHRVDNLSVDIVGGPEPQEILCQLH